MDAIARPLIRHRGALSRPLDRLADALGRVDAGAVALLVMPWLLLAAAPLWVYAPLYRDAWAYFGFFQNLPGHLAAFGDHYSAGRLSVLIPGWLVHSLLPPVAANLVLHIAVHSVATLSGYAALSGLVGRRAAFLTMALMGGHYFFLRAAGWDYPDGYVIAYFLMATALAVRAGGLGRWRSWAAAAGAAAAAMVTAYLGSLVLLAPLAGVFVLANRNGARHPLDTAGFWVGAGFLGAVAGFAAVSKALGGPAAYFVPSLIFASRTFGPEAAAQYIFPFRDWVGRAGWLVLPAAAAAGAVVLLTRTALRWRRGEARRGEALSAFLQFQLIGLASLYAVKQARGEIGYLQVWLASSWAIMAPAFLAIGGQLGRWADGLSRQQFRAVAAVWMAAAVGGCLIAARLPQAGAAGAIPLAAALVGTVAAVLLIQILPPRAGVGAAAAMLFAVAGASSQARFHMADSLLGAGAPIRVTRAEAFDPLREKCFRTITEAASWANGLGPAGKTWFWYDLEAPLGPVYDMAAHTSCHYIQVVGIRFPELADGKVYRGDPIQVIARSGGGAVVVFSDDPAAAEKALYWLRGCGMRADVEGERVIGQAPIAIRAVVIRVAPERE